MVTAIEDNAIDIPMMLFIKFDRVQNEVGEYVDIFEVTDPIYNNIERLAEALMGYDNYEKTTNLLFTALKSLMDYDYDS